ncbi:MAG: hypothetical protein M1818_006403 [Claussenomyces sp. TS43310]|nr:MAG: hypothetical protein M1818_006403 [Claussenomyces sp. TS43310]
MNWTGGRLSNSRQAQGSMKARQKQHFAKIRNNSLNGKPKRSPTHFDNLPQHEPLVSKNRRRYASAQARASYVPPRPVSVNCEKLASREDLVHKECTRTSRSAVTSEIDEVKEEPLDDIYDATPPPEQVDPHVTELHKFHARSDVDHGRGDESLTFRKLRLLGQSEWLGTRILRPLKLKHQQPRHTDRLGRRRRISPDYQAHYGAKVQTRIPSPFAMTRNRLDLDSPVGGDRHHLRHLTKRNDDVRIYIGGREVPVGTSSNGTQSRLLLKTIQPSHQSSADVMLLDREDVNSSRGASEGADDKWTVFNSDELSPHRQSLLVLIYGPSELIMLQAGITSYGKPILRPAQQQYCDIPEESSGGGHEFQFYKAKNDSHSRRIVKIYDSHHNQRSEAATGLTLSSDRMKPFLKRKDTAIQDLEEAEIEAHNIELQDLPHGVCEIVALHSSQGSQHGLRHPAPLSSRTSKLLSSDSDASGSMVAQLGAPRPIVPPSQILDNEIWKSWLLSSDDVDDWDESAIHNYANDKAHETSWMSPGSSTIVHHISCRNSQRKSPADGEGGEETMRQTLATLVGKNNFKAGAVAIACRQRGDIQETNNANPTRDFDSQKLTDLTDPERSRATEIRFNYPRIAAADGWREQTRGLTVTQRFDKLGQGSTKRGINLGKLDLPRDLQSYHMQRRTQKNPDEAWMKFVFSSSDDEEDGPDISSEPGRNHFRTAKSPSPRSSLLVETSPATPNKADGWSKRERGNLPASNPAACATDNRKRPPPKDVVSHDSGEVSTSSPDPLCLLMQPSQSRQKESSAREMVTFKRPRPFSGRKSSSGLSAINPEPLSRTTRGARWRHTRKRGKDRKGRDIFDLPESDADDTESIEDG